jgi:hypothetical protein
MHRFVIVIMGGAIIAMALAVISLSAVAVMAQTMALLSQCVLALGMIGVGLIVASRVALRNRVIQVYLARRLLGTDADRVLAEQQPDRVEALPQTFPRNHALLPPERASIQTASVQTTVMQAPRQSTMLTLPTLPAMPRGWGFEEED